MDYKTSINDSFRKIDFEHLLTTRPCTKAGKNDEQNLPTRKCSGVGGVRHQSHKGMIAGCDKGHLRTRWESLTAASSSLGRGFPGSAVVRNLLAIAGDAGDMGSIPGSKIPWRRKPAPVFLCGKSHGQMSLAGYSPRGRKQSDMTEHSTITSLGISEGCPEKAFGLHIEGGVGFNQEKGRGKNISWKEQHALY